MAFFPSFLDLARLLQCFGHNAQAPATSPFRRPIMNRYKAFDFRASILAIVATLFLSTSSLLFAAGPVGQASATNAAAQDYPLA
jgi:hypothetical protein